MWVCVILICATAPLRELILRKSTCSVILKSGMGPSYAQAIWTYKAKRKTHNMADKYFSMISYHSEGLLHISIFRIPPFSSDFNIVWMKPYHCTRVRLPVLCKLWTNPLINLKLLCEAMIGLKENFRLIYSNTHLRTRETLPLSHNVYISPTFFQEIFCTRILSSKRYFVLEYLWGLCLKKHR